MRFADDVPLRPLLMAFSAEWVRIQQNTRLNYFRKFSTLPSHGACWKC